MSTLLENNATLLYMQFALALILIAAWVYVFVTTGQSNPELLGLASLAIGFFFGAETVERVSKARR